MNCIMHTANSRHTQQLHGIYQSSKFKTSHRIFMLLHYGRNGLNTWSWFTSGKSFFNYTEALIEHEVSLTKILARPN